MITKKLLDFQKLGISLKKDGVNPHFKSSYVTLNEVLAKVKAPLNGLSIVIVQATEANGLTTRLIDTEDDTTIECFVPFINTTDMQKLGGAITYARRYSLITLLGLDDDDDDGNTASEPTVQYAPKNAPKATVAPKKTPFETASEKISKATTAEELSTLSTQVNESVKLTADEKADLQDSIQALASLIA